jgi:hypothetical protein
LTTNLRERAESDLKHSLESGFGLPVTLIDPDGVTIDTKNGTTDPLVGQVLYDTVRVNPETGEDMIVNNPIVTLRRSSLSRIPKAGEKWFVKIPVTPSETAELVDFVTDSTRPPEGGNSIGFVRLYLRKAQQKL